MLAEAIQSVAVEAMALVEAASMEAAS